MIGFIIGLFVGGFLGVFVMCLCNMASRADNATYNMMYENTCASGCVHLST